MAKKKVVRKKNGDSPTKASVIREVHEADKTMGPSAVARAAAEKLGVPFSQGLVSQASTIMKNGSKKKGGKKKGRKAAANMTAPASGSLAQDLMEAAKEVEVAIQKFTEQASAAISAKIRQMITPKN